MSLTIGRGRNQSIDLAKVFASDFNVAEGKGIFWKRTWLQVMYF